MERVAVEITGASMAVEIERKFLVNGDAWRGSVKRTETIRQAYFPGQEGFSIRVRRAADRAFLTIKTTTLGARRDEFEYPIPIDDAEALLAQIARYGLIEKTRHWLNCDGTEWSVDEYSAGLQGLVIAEIELDSEKDHFSLPPWAGVEVTENPLYRNQALAERTRVV